MTNNNYAKTGNNYAGVNWFQKWRLRTKATAIAIALSLLPIVAVGGITYYVADKKIANKVLEDKTDRAIDAADKVNRFLRARYGDIRAIAKLQVFTTTNLQKAATPSQKQAALQRFVDAYGVYDSIAVVSVDGFGTIVSQTKGKILPNGVLQNQSYYKEALKTNGPVITLELALSNKQWNIFMAAPVKDKSTGKTIAVVRARITLSAVEELLKNYASSRDDYYLIGPDGKFYITSQKNAIGKQAIEYYSNVSELRSAGTPSAKLAVNLVNHYKEVVAYSPLGKIKGLPEIRWGILITTDSEKAFALQRKLFTTLASGIGLTILVVGAIAIYLANRATRPILTAAKAVEKIGAGELDTRIAILGGDELAVLGYNINLMADEIKILLVEQAAETLRVQKLADITSRIRQTLKPEDVLQTAVREIQQALKSDRVAVLRFDTINSDSDGSVVAESVASGWTKLLGNKILETRFFGETGFLSPPETRFLGETGFLHMFLGETGFLHINNIDLDPNLTNTHKQWLHQYQVKAALVAPIAVREELYGLLMAHQCSTARDWQPSEINFFAQLATQVGIALEQANLLEQIDSARLKADLMASEQKQQKEAISMQLLELLSDVEAASGGDLTVRANITASDIGTVGDFFNSIIESLRQVVSQVIAAAAKVNGAVGHTEVGIRELAELALQQATDITRTLTEVEQMTISITSVASSAHSAAEVARSAAITAEAGGVAMDGTVQSILNLRETISETAEKVKRLGESSQQISQAVSLIKQIALQTNVLAINASFEAARAGEEGRGFAVVASEVGKLAARSAAASQEIQRIVENIQLETKEVVEAMEIGTTQVVDGARQVSEAKQSLGQIVEVSRQIDELVQSISNATVSQAETSRAVMNLMNDIAKVSSQTSQSSHEVSGSLQQTISVARQLQESVSVFKVN